MTPKPVTESSSAGWPKDATRAEVVVEADDLVARADLVAADLVAIEVDDLAAEDREVIAADVLVVDLVDPVVVDLVDPVAVVAVAAVDSAVAAAWNTQRLSWPTVRFTSRRLEASSMSSTRHRRWSSRGPIN